jgi:hypothetical protein
VFARERKKKTTPLRDRRQYYNTVTSNNRTRKEEVAHGREMFQELFSALLARESQTRKWGKAKQNQTEPNQTSLLQTAASSPPPAGWLAGWMAWLAPSAHPAVDGTAEEPNGSGTEQRTEEEQQQSDGNSSNRSTAATAEAADLIELRPISSIIHSDCIGYHPSLLVRIIGHHPSFIARSTDIIHHSF